MTTEKSPYAALSTEGRNPRSTHIDTMSTREMLECIHAEDQAAVDAVGQALPQIGNAIERIVRGMERGGRLFYIGCGTSGRLGVLDASECPPTFGVSPETVIGIIAGGDKALRSATEGAEDSFEAGFAALSAHNPRPEDTVVGLSAAGGAAFVLGGIECARKAGCGTVGICCNPGTKLSQAVEYPIEALTGPEVITGSTRMKAGTAQKLILNQLSTCAMIRTGKVRENLMIHLRPTNRKLRDRAVRMIRELYPCSPEEALGALDRAGNDVAQALALLEGEA